jgi:hypothetical protein
MIGSDQQRINLKCDGGGNVTAQVQSEKKMALVILTSASLGEQKC